MSNTPPRPSRRARPHCARFVSMRRPEGGSVQRLPQHQLSSPVFSASTTQPPEGLQAAADGENPGRLNLAVESSIRNHDKGSHSTFRRQLLRGRQPLGAHACHQRIMARNRRVRLWSSCGLISRDLSALTDSSVLSALFFEHRCHRSGRFCFVGRDGSARQVKMWSFCGLIP